MTDEMTDALDYQLTLWTELAAYLQGIWREYAERVREVATRRHICHRCWSHPIPANSPGHRHDCISHHGQSPWGFRHQLLWRQGRLVTPPTPHGLSGSIRPAANFSPVLTGPPSRFRAVRSEHPSGGPQYSVQDAGGRSVRAWWRMGCEPRWARCG
jgi:hypothetical protein